jgi:hypothetical protein
VADVKAFVKSVKLRVYPKGKATLLKPVPMAAGSESIKPVEVKSASRVLPNTKSVTVNSRPEPAMAVGELQVKRVPEQVIVLPYSVLDSADGVSKNSAAGNTLSINLNRFMFFLFSFQ